LTLIMLKEGGSFVEALRFLAVRANAVKLLIRRWSKKAGVPRLHAHLCRHTFATNYLIHNCGDVFRLQQLPGPNETFAKPTIETFFEVSIAPCFLFPEGAGL